jgi:hypothetical protein
MGASVGVIGVIIVGIIAVAQVKVYLIRPGDGDLAGRMITDNPFGIFRIRRPFRLLRHFIVVIRCGIIHIGIIRFDHFNARIPAVVFVDVTVFALCRRLFTF